MNPSTGIYKTINSREIATLIFLHICTAPWVKNTVQNTLKTDLPPQQAEIPRISLCRKINDGHISEPTA